MTCNVTDLRDEIYVNLDFDLRASLDVVIPTYNDNYRLNLLLTGLTNQLDKNFTVYVVDDGGDNEIETRQLVESYRSLKINYIYNGPQSSISHIAAAKNKGWRAGTGERVLFFDGDVIPAPDVTFRHRACIYDSIIIGIRLMVKEPLSTRLLEQDVFTLKTLPYELDVRLQDKYVQQLYYSCKPMPWTAWYGCHISYPRQALVAVGGENEEIIGWGRDDDELAAKVVHAGYLGYLRPDCQVYHLNHPIQQSEYLEHNTRVLHKTLKACNLAIP